jgi:hypothetical protein
MLSRLKADSRWLLSAMLLVWLCGQSGAAESLERTGTQWSPFIEWALRNESIKGNPFDVSAAATFTHVESGAQRTTPMFFAGGKSWKFRFTGTHPGRWDFTTGSTDPELDGRSGTVTIRSNDDAYGFVTHVGNKWARPFGSDGTPRGLVPQFVMYGHPGTFYGKPDRVDADIRTFIGEHGFTGFHVPVFCRWFDIEHDRANEIPSNDPGPDPRTFEALEMLITKVHAAGGVVHLWEWGDESRRQTPRKWGINGTIDKRLQRYIAARLGPLPGWTMGYGFDLDEWVNEKQLGEWRAHMHKHMGWPHMLGGRHGDPNRGLDHSSAVSWNRRLDYSSFEHHRPNFDVYRASLQAVPGQPAFSEDRFRIRQSKQYRDKDYDEDMTRRGLWHSTMAGGVANIWGRLDNDLAINKGGGASLPYEHPEWIRTWADFFKKRFTLDAEPALELTNGHCLKRRTGEHFVFYREDTNSIQMDLSRMNGDRPAIAVDTLRRYREISLGRLSTKNQTWSAPYKSDWAIAVGSL